MLLAAAGMLVWHGPALGDHLRGFMLSFFRATFAASPPTPQAALDAAMTTVVACLLPLLLVVVGVAVLVSLLQVRPLFTLFPLKPQLRRLDPLSGLKQLFGGRGLFTAAISTAKILVVGTVLVWTIGGELRNLLLLVTASPTTAVAAFGDVTATLLWRGAFVLLGLSLLDVVYQRHRFLKDQRMTKQEVKQEQRETEGDQSQKGERKRLHQELLEQAMIEQVRNADVVIVNPTHIAVALGYQPDEDEAPVVLASGENLLARKIVEVARRHGIPVLRDVQLARGLVEVEVGEHIPEELFEAVAEILRFVLIGPTGEEHDGR